MSLESFLQQTTTLADTDRMPALFVGHGSPMNGIENNIYSESWKALGQAFPHPRAILSISAHWYIEGTLVHVSKKPRTIHDFYGFPKELYDMEYPCPGAPEVAEATRLLADDVVIGADNEWGIDHGTWIVLSRMFPNHDIPTFQLSIDLRKPAEFHYNLGRTLAPLRKKGILIMGSGNVVHNLGQINFDPNAEAFDWAKDFDESAKGYIANDEHDTLIHYEKLGEAAHLSIPTPDHYLPLLYVLGLKEKGEEVTFPVEGVAHGSVSMRTVRVG